MTAPEPHDDVEALVEHMAECTGASAAIVMHTGSADEVVARMIAAGYVLEERVDYVAGKRIRFLTTPTEKES